MGVSVNQIIQETLSNFGQKQSQQTDGDIANALNLESQWGFTKNRNKLDPLKQNRGTPAEKGGMPFNKGGNAGSAQAQSSSAGGSRQWGGGGGEHPAGVANRSGFKGGQHPTAGANTSGQMQDANVASKNPSISPQAAGDTDKSGIVDHLKDAASNPWVQGAAGAAGLVGAGLAGRKYLKARRAKAGK